MLDGGTVKIVLVVYTQNQQLKVDNFLFMVPHFLYL